jgi:hypothetical protein
MLERIKPFYEVNDLGASSTLYESPPCVLQQGEKQLPGHLKVIQDWGIIRVEFWFTSDSGPGLAFGNATVTFGRPSSSAIKLGVIGLAEDHVWGLLTAPIDVGSNHKLNRVTFHLPNFPDIVSETWAGDTEMIGKTEAYFTWSQVELEDGGWRIVLQPHRKLVSLRHKAINNRTFALTGIGEIRRSDGGLFAKKDVIPVLDGLRIFLSFALAEWCPPLLIVGANAKTEKSWQRFSYFEVGQRWYSTGWLDDRHGDILTDAYPGFCDLWAKKEWQTPLTQAVAWLIQATGRPNGAEGSIAFGQIPLEMLAWMAFVDTKPIVDSKEFENLSANSKLQLLLHSCGIPLAVPDGLETLRKVATQQDKTVWSGPRIATDIRNTIIHPNKKNRDKLAGWVKGKKVNESQLLIETHELFRWYITLVLLRLMDYGGLYANRLVPRIPGTLEMVPWAT